MDLPFKIEVMDIAHSYFIDYLSDEYDEGYGDHSPKVASIIRELVFQIEILGNEKIKNDNRYQFYKAFYNCKRAHHAYEEMLDLKWTTMEDISKNGKEFFEEFIIDKDKIINIENYILRELDTILDEDHQKEMAARGVLYRACSKAIWNPRCELGKRMIMKRLEKDGLSEIIE
tara:strand:- start:1277 stop:1795 length:519 start_codon:yes stop_codon:yes gene_type:complete